MKKYFIFVTVIFASIFPMGAFAGDPGMILSPIKMKVYVLTVDAEKVTFNHLGQQFTIPRQLVSQDLNPQVKPETSQFLYFDPSTFDKLKQIVASKD